MKTIHSKAQIPDSILGVKLSEKTIEELLEGKETSLIKGFKHKSGESFDAFLTLNPDNKLVFRILESKNIGNTEDKENFKTQISIADIALDLGFQPSLDVFPSELSVYDYLLMTGSRGERIIIHKDQSNLEYKFFALDIPGLSGNVYDFLECFTAQLPEKNREYLEKFSRQLSKSPFYFLPSVHNLETAFQSIFQIEALSSKQYFIERGLKDSTLEHSFFRGKIFGKYVKNENIVTEEPCFPIYSFGKINSYSFFSTDLFDSAKPKNGIWHSNIINPDKVRRLIIFSDPIESLFYHQINAKPSDLFTVYASVLGDKNDEQIRQIQYLIDTCKPENVIIATSDDANGLLWENALLGGLVEPRELVPEFNILKESSSEIRFQIQLLKERSSEFCSLSVHLTYNDPEKGFLMNENLLKYFNQINEKEIKEHPELENRFPFIFSQRIISRHESIAPISFPYRKEYLDIISKVIQHLRPILLLKVEKPKLGLFEKTVKHQNEERLVFKEMKARKLG